MAYIQKNNPFKFSPIKQPLTEEIKPTSLTTKQKLQDLEKKIDEKLDRPGQRAQAQAIGEYDYELNQKKEEIDRFRHTLAGAYTSKKVGIVGANILGLAHEIIAPNTPSEHKSDLINNAIGSIIGRIPFINEKQTIETIKWLNDRGWLSEHETSGEPAETLYPKRFDPSSKQDVEMKIFQPPAPRARTKK